MTFLFLVLVLGFSLIQNMNAWLIAEPGIIPLRSILSSRVVVSTITEKLSYELIDDYFAIHFASSLLHQCSYCHSSDIFSNVLLFTAIINLKNINSVSKIEKLGSFTDVRNFTNRFIWIFILIFTKNIDNAI